MAERSADVCTGNDDELNAGGYSGSGGGIGALPYSAAMWDNVGVQGTVQILRREHG